MEMEMYPGAAATWGTENSAAWTHGASGDNLLQVQTHESQDKLCGVENGALVHHSMMEGHPWPRERVAELAWDEHLEVYYRMHEQRSN